MAGTWDEAKMHAAVLRGRHARPLIGPSENPPGPRGPLHPGHACPWALDTASRHNLPFVRGVQYRQPGQLREPHTVSVRRSVFGLLFVWGLVRLPKGALVNSTKPRTSAISEQPEKAMTILYTPLAPSSNFKERARGISLHGIQADVSKYGVRFEARLAFSAGAFAPEVQQVRVGVKVGCSTCGTS